jgi:hypothetical protein
MKNKIKNFFKEYEELCKKYNFSLAHEDCEGGFILEEFNEDNINWVKSAYIDKYEYNFIDWKKEEKELENLTNERDKLKTELEQIIGNENWLLLDDEIFDTMECETVRKATEYEMELRTKIRRLELKINKFI